MGDDRGERFPPVEAISGDRRESATQVLAESVAVVVVLVLGAFKFGLLDVDQPDFEAEPPEDGPEAADRGC